MRNKICYAVIIAAVAAFVILYIAGIATLDAADAVGMTVTRACGCAAFTAIIIMFRYRVLNPYGIKTGAAGFVKSLPCVAVAVNNLPIIPLITGGVIITAGGDEVFLLALECLFIGLFEELAFRGVIFLVILEKYRGTRRRVFLSALISSAAFGAVHFFNLLSGAGFGATVLQAGYSFLIGGMCAFVLIISGSLTLCVIIHAVYDFCGYLIPRCGEGTVWTVPSIALTAAVGAAALIYVLLSFRHLNTNVVDKIFDYDE